MYEASVVAAVASLLDYLQQAADWPQDAATLLHDRPTLTPLFCEMLQQTLTHLADQHPAWLMRQFTEESFMVGVLPRMLALQMGYRGAIAGPEWWAACHDHFQLDDTTTPDYFNNILSLAIALPFQWREQWALGVQGHPCLQKLESLIGDLGDEEESDVELEEELEGIATAEGRFRYHLNVIGLDRENWRRIERHYDQVRRIWHRIDHEGDLLNFLEAFTGYQNKQGHWQDMLEWTERILQVTEGRLPNRQKATVLTGLARIHLSQGNTPAARACCQQAWELIEGPDNEVQQARLFKVLGIIEGQGGNLHKALSYHEQALYTYRQGGGGDQEASYLYEVGMSYHQVGKSETALDYVEPAKKLCEEAHDHDTMVGVLHGLALIHIRLGWWRDASISLHGTLAWQRQRGDLVGQVTTLCSLANLYDELRLFQQARMCINQALQLAEHRKLRMLGSLLNQAALISAHEGDLQGAFRYVQRALLHDEELGDKAGQAAALTNMASFHLHREQFRAAREEYRRAAAMFEEGGDEVGLATLQSGLGDALRGLGMEAEARECYQRAATVYEQLNAEEASEERIDVYHRLATIYGRLERWEEAIQLLTDLLLFAEEGEEDEADHPALVADTLESLGAIYFKMCRYQEAQDTFERVLALRQEWQDRQALLPALRQLVEVFFKLEAWAQAIPHIEHALRIGRELALQETVARSLHNLGQCYQKLARSDEALPLLQEALVICQEIELPIEQSRILMTFGSLYDQLENWSESASYFGQALSLLKGTEHFERTAKCLHYLGGAHKELHEYDKALGYYKEAMAFSRKTGDRFGMGATQHNMARIYQDLGQHGKAKRLYRKVLSRLSRVEKSPQHDPDMTDLAASAHRKMAELCRHEEQWDEAVHHYAWSAMLSQEYGNIAEAADTLRALGRLAHRLGNSFQAAAIFESALSLLEEAGDQGRLGRFLNELGGLYVQIGEWQKAEPCLTRALVIHLESGNLVEEAEARRGLAFLYAGKQATSAVLREMERVIEIDELLALPDLEEDRAALLQIKQASQTQKNHPLSSRLRQLGNWLKAHL